MVAAFECIDDQTAANMLFDAAELAEGAGHGGHGRPHQPGERNMFLGLSSRTMRMFRPSMANYNPPYHVKLFEDPRLSFYFKMQKQLFY